MEKTEKTGQVAENIEHIFRNTERIHGKSEAIDWVKVASHKAAEWITHQPLPEPKRLTDEDATKIYDGTLNKLEVLIDNAIDFNTESYDREVLDQIYRLFVNESSNHVSPLSDARDVKWNTTIIFPNSKEIEDYCNGDKKIEEAVFWCMKQIILKHDELPHDTLKSDHIPDARDKIIEKQDELIYAMKISDEYGISKAESELTALQGKEIRRWQQ